MRRWWRFAWLFPVFGVWPALPVGADSPLELAERSGAQCVVATLPPALTDALGSRRIAGEQWGRVLQVRTAEAATSDPPGPTIFGSYSLHGAELVFRPRLPFLPGTEYHGTLDLVALARLTGVEGVESGASLTANPSFTFRMPSEAVRVPRVVAIYPASDRVPGNLLRAYVEFSQPMRPDVVADYLHLVDAAGREVQLPFVEIDGGLWDPRGTRLTLLFHPGRLKRGVAPREELGPPLATGATYRLVVDAGWPSATGEPLRSGVSQSWTVDAEDRGPVTPDTWALEVPRVGSTEPLAIDFGESLDHALALRMITVLLAGHTVSGTPRLAADDTRWTFHPSAPWNDAEYSLHVQPGLEDVAGNNLRGLFDREGGQVEEAAAPAELRFQPRQ